MPGQRAAWWIVILAGTVLSQARAEDAWWQTAGLDKAPAAVGSIRSEAGGLRMQAPLQTQAEWQQSPARFQMLLGSKRIAGDFLWTATYDVIQLGPMGQPITAEGNAEVSLMDRNGGQGIYGINVGVRPNVRGCFNILRMETKRDGGSHFGILTVPRKSDQGRIAMQRKGQELIFSVADGPDAVLKEVVRFPYLADAEPRFRALIYSGHGKDQMPVDILFKDVQVTADKLVEDSAAFPVQRAMKPPAIKLDYQTNPTGILRDFPTTNDKANAIRVDGSALRIAPPVAPNYDRTLQGHHYRETKLSLAGDFECRYRYTIEKMGPITTNGYGSLAFGLSFESKGPLGSFSVTRGMARGEGQRYSISRYAPTSQGGHWDTKSFRTQPMQATVIVRRVGALIAVETQEDGKEPVPLDTFPWDDRPIKALRILVDQGGDASNPVNVALENLSLAAERIEEAGRVFVNTPVEGAPANGAAGPVVLTEAPKVARNKWLYLGLALAGVLLAIFVGVFWGRRRQQAD
jgi:hypothetical protein